MSCNYKDDHCNFGECNGIYGDPFKHEQEIWKEIYKLYNKSSNVSNEVLEALYYNSINMFEHLAEINRAMGQSGMLSSRQYNFDHSNDTGYAPINLHNHPNHKNLFGSAEFSGILNGYYFRSRHNDYRMVRTGDMGDNYLATRPIDSPEVPSDITGTVENQVNVARDYFKVLNNDAPQTTVADYSNAFNVVLSYLECWWELVGDGNFEDPFDSDRHQINADTVRELLDRDQYFAYGGHKNRLENGAHLVATIKDVKNGNPVYAILKYRVLCKKVGSITDYPINNILDPVTDYLTQERFGITTNKKRFKLKQQQNSDDSYNWNRPAIVDELMGKIYGLDGEGASLLEGYYEYGHNYELYEYGKQIPLNAAKYSRFYTMQEPDASGRQNARRGFRDPTLWTAKTTREKVFTRYYDNNEYAFSFAIPLEIIIDSFLNNWNPNNVQLLNKNDVQGSGDTQTDPYNGYSNGPHYYHTPGTFFTDVPDPDPADTGTTSKWVLDGQGNPVVQSASGHWESMPEIPEVSGRVRMRYPVYPVYYEGNEIYEQFFARFL